MFPPGCGTVSQNMTMPRRRRMPIGRGLLRASEHSLPRTLRELRRTSRDFSPTVTERLSVLGSIPLREFYRVIARGSGSRGPGRTPARRTRRAFPEGRVAARCDCHCWVRTSSGPLSV